MPLATSEPKVPVTWVSREPPLTPVVVIGVGEVGERLLARARSDAEPSRWTGVRSDGLVALCGSDLPWVDGVSYFGEDPDAKGLHVPTWLKTQLHPALVARALRRLGVVGPVALIPGTPLRVVPLGEARPL
jgi:hypothetical protein